MESNEIKMFLATSHDNVIGFLLAFFLLLVFVFLIMPLPLGLKCLMILFLLFGFFIYLFIGCAGYYKSVCFQKDEIIFKKLWISNSKIISYSVKDLESIKYDDLSSVLTFFFRDYHTVSIKLCESVGRVGDTLIPNFQIKRDGKIILEEYPMRKVLNNPREYVRCVYYLIENFYKINKVE